MAQQTAVNWLEEKIELDMSVMEILGLIRQAKEMENNQIINAFESGEINTDFQKWWDAEQYYNETFTSTLPTENPSAKETEQ